jgi:hypothetical protein
MHDDENVQDFIIFCIEEYKAAKGLTGKEAQELFDKTGAYEYLENGYDVLHTFGSEHIISDLDRYFDVRT